MSQGGDNSYVRPKNPLSTFGNLYKRFRKEFLSFCIPISNSVRLYISETQYATLPTGPTRNRYNFEPTVFTILANLPGANFTRDIHRDTYSAIAPALSNCKGKSVYITGASKGIGLALALAYATAGASKIGIGARSLSATVQDDIITAATKAGHAAPQILKHRLDVTDAASVSECAKGVENEFGNLDILINNAGYLEKFSPLCEGDENEYRRTWDINIHGVYLVSKALIPLMLQRGDKTIINISSIGALFLSHGASGYQTSKFALLRFTEFLNVDYGQQGLLAYCVHPGGIPTDLAMNMPTSITSRGE